MEYSSTAASGLIDIITDPTKALIAADKEPKRLWVPLILAMVIPIILSVYYFSTVDIDWMFTQLQTAMIAQGQEFPDETRAFFSPGILMGGAIFSTILMVWISTAFSAFYLLMVAKFTSEDKRPFFTWFSLSAWVNVPGTIAAFVMIIYFAVLGSSQIGFEDLSFFSLNSLVTHYPAGTPEAGFFSGISPFLVWTVGLLGLGIKTWTGRTLGTSLMIAAAPYVVIFGLWGFFVL